MKSMRLPEAEFEIMDMIWDSELPVTTSMVWEKVGKRRGVKLQSINTLFARLEARGFLRVERNKIRERDFYPIVTRDQYLQMETEHFVRRYHKQSYTSLLNALQRDQLTNDDLDELAKWVNETRMNSGR